MNPRKSNRLLQKIRTSFITKVVALVTIQGLLIPLFPTPVRANTGPVDTNYAGGSGGELVDMSSGSFNYSIPLMDVGGFPIQLSYNADVSMDQKASLVGLGWDLNLAAINRTVRGIPDDFNGDQISTTMNLRPRLTIENTLDNNQEAIGLDLLSLNGVQFGYTFNNYTGNENSISKDFTFLKHNLGIPGAEFSGSAGIESSSKSGLSTNLGVSMAYNGEKNQYKTSLGLNRNSLYGSSLDVGFGYSRAAKKEDGRLVRILKNSINGSGTYPLGMQSYTPTANFEFYNKSVTIDGAVGGLVFAGIDIHGSYSRTKSTVCLREHYKSQSAYGYLNQEKGYGKDALQDFNLALPQVHENVKGLPTPVPTNDYFVAPSGMFRAIRNDAGYVKNPTTKSYGETAVLGLEFAFSPAPLSLEVGLNPSYSMNNSESGNWEGYNPFSDLGIFEYEPSLPFGDEPTQAKYEKFTFQKVNNRSSIAPTQYEGIRGETAMRQQIYKDAGKIKAHAYMATDDGGDDYPVIANTYYQTERRDRNEVLQHISNAELRSIGDNTFENYTLNDFTYSGGSYNNTPKSRDASNYPNHHIGQLEIIGSGGAKEVYGLPVMNESDQVSFNISAINNAGHSAPEIDEQGLVRYVADGDNKDNTLANKRGDDHFYLKNHVPAHATSYLLTQQLSANYSDRTGDGPTPDDYGSYVKFNYGYEGVKEWRFPYQKNKATFDEGFKSNLLDDKASYTYGKRDDWYVHSIETKDYIAELVYSNRNDAHGVQGENGGVDIGQKAKKLDQIKLFTRKAKEYYGDAAIPMKTAHFVYNYELCPNTPDNINYNPSYVYNPLDPPVRGKLTLKEVYFTGYDSKQGKLNKYKFTYGVNKPYSLGQTDRWGNYQVASGVDHAISSPLDNAEYPYTHQDIISADNSAKVWKLSAIDLPIGSRIEIDYESDDYEYIQNVEATRMYKIGGFYSTEEESGDFRPGSTDFGAALFDPDNNDEDNYYIRVDLDNPLVGEEAEANIQFYNHFIPQKTEPNKRYLYYNTLLNLAPHNDGIVDPDVYEYIQGYAQIVEGGWYLLESSEGSGIWDQAVFQVHPMLLNQSKPGSPKIQPVSRKAWQVIKEALPLVMYPEEDLQIIYAKDGSIQCGPEEVLEDGETEPDLGLGVKSHRKNIKSIKSVYHMMRNTGYASRAVLPKCWVRMRSGLTSKIGGGYRVKEIKTYDNWEQFVAGENGAVYGTKYEYTTKNGNNETISSGVASYEPLNGGDEIALRKPHFYEHGEKGILRAPTELFYTEYPLNEQIFSTAQVRYSSVKSSSISYEGLLENTPGYTIQKHFTAKDYPIRWDYTNPHTELKPPGIAALSPVSIRRFGVSFGASIVTNDMHGKFKEKVVFDANDNVIYKMEHLYHEKEMVVGEPGFDEKTIQVLENKVSTIHPDGSAEERIIGQSTDLITYLGKSESSNARGALKINGEFTFPGVPAPSLWPEGNLSETHIYTTLTTKVIFQTGLLQKVRVEDNGRTKYVENLLYDAKTGAAIATEITPEKGDGVQKMYEYTTPAYWKYQALGLASDNINITRNNITGSGSTILTEEKQYFNPGDELRVVEFLGLIPTALENYWVIENEASGEYFLANKEGQAFTPDPSKEYGFKVLYPGNTNQTGASMTSISTLKKHMGSSPYITDGNTTYMHEEVINVSAVDFFESAKLNRNNCIVVDDTINPYVHNLKGQWKPHHSYVFDGNRDYSNDDSRKDGLLTAYQPFWQINESGWYKSDPLQNWIKTGTATLFDAYGHALESKNALNIYNSQGIGYNQQMAKNSNSNARYTEAGFDGFEDYYVDGTVDGLTGITPNFTPYACNARHFEAVSATNHLNDQEAHTGKYSMYAKLRDVVFESTIWDGAETPSATHGQPYEVEETDRLPGLRFLNSDPDNRYVATVWAKEMNPSKVHTYDGAGIMILKNTGAWEEVPIEETRSNIIDGWQRIEVVFDVSGIATNTEIEVRLVKEGTYGVHYDDFRIQPYDSEMQSVVVDPVHMRSTADMDGRDFSTSYQYDENGVMIRVIQETEKGKQTIKETRSAIRINN